MTGSLRQLRRAALIAIGVLVTAASVTSFAESYRGLYLWAGHHGLHGIWAAGFPLQVDVFVAVGELALFVALADSWPARSRVAAWGVTVAGLAVSVAGNVGHIAGHDLASRATAAVPPLAAAAALAVGLGVLKRVVALHETGKAAADSGAAPGIDIANAIGDLGRSPAPEMRNGVSHLGAVPAALGNGHAVPEGSQLAAEIFSGELAGGAVPSIRRIRDAIHCGQARAQQVHAYLETLTPAGRSIRCIRDEIRQGSLTKPSTALEQESGAEHSRTT